jgi:hypothetical protein
MRGNLLKKEIIFGIVILLTSTSLMPVFAGSSTQPTKEKNVTPAPALTPQKTTTITFYVFEKTKLEKHTMIMSVHDAKEICSQFQELKKAFATQPFTERTKSHVQQFISLLMEKHAIPMSVSRKDLMSLLQPPEIPTLPYLKHVLPLQGTHSEWFCNFATGGEGAAFPIIILPRLIPIILMPIPRIFVKWSTPNGLTSVGGLISHKGFIASGQQKGLALGFWGIGFSVFLPPIDAYGIIGYAAFAKVTAEYFESWPPNNPPEITQTDPADGQQMVPLSTSELRFSISDADGDLMSYNVTTNPDIGSGRGGLKPDGVYSIPVSGLDALTNYTWSISVTDGKDTTAITNRFTTEPVGPVITTPVPENNERDVPMNLAQLKFTIKDYQGLVMEYTVQTSPNIGSDHKVGVHDGTYSVPVSGMSYGAEYRWFVNVTDGTYWARKAYSFQTGFPSPFDPFAYGWHYRKQITIDHTQVSGDLTNFPVLISTTDPDLTKAQSDGDDILFMDNLGAAVKWHHEIETFNATSGELVAWVNVPTLSSSQDTTFYMYYGNPSCINQEYPEKTWDSHYQAVWHMNDATSSTIKDSTINGNDGTKKEAYQPVEWNGKVGKGQRYNHSDTLWEYIVVNNPNALSMSGDFTISAWVNPFTDDAMKIAGKHQDSSGDYKGYALNWNVGSIAKMSLRVDDGGYNYQYTYADEAKPPNNWYYMSGATQAGTNFLYIDGTQQSSAPQQSLLNSNNPFCIGAWRTTGPSMNFFGIIDEVRVSNMKRSTAWIQTEYHTMNDPNQFLAIGPEVPGP